MVSGRIVFMDQEHIVQNYLSEVAKKFSNHSSTEMGYRTECEQFLKTVFDIDGKVKKIDHDGKAQKGNKPDFVIYKNEVPILYIEAKDIGISLDKVETGEQMQRYFGYDNLVLTDYLEFRFYRNGEKYGDNIKIADYNKSERTLIYHLDKYDLLVRTLKDFPLSHKETIKNGKRLAQIMGGKAQRIRDNVFDMLTHGQEKQPELFKVRNVIKENLMSSFDDKDFADMYAQTIVYGLFAARYNDISSENFSRIEAKELVPVTNPFLRSFFDHIAGISFPKQLGYIVDELCEVFTHADIHKLLNDFYGKVDEKDLKDPVIHFYEDFLKEYDSKKKMEMGVFYTPRPVVNFIVRAVDEVLKNEFSINNGLADNQKIQKETTIYDPKKGMKKENRDLFRVQILDVATGTGTFLNEIIKYIHNASFAHEKSLWNVYVNENLIPRLHGFELMIASYTIAHLKLGITLQESGVKNIKERLGIYLANTLDAPKEHNASIFNMLGLMDAVTEENRLADDVKHNRPIMVIVGNPPYSGISMNRQYTDNDVYKVEIGGKEKLKEKKNWLDDDYVKFIRFAESMIEKNGEGVVGMITAHGYIDNPTFRGMRWHLRKTFNKIYIVDLHGNSNKKETTKEGGKDENVFDIKTGVSILIGIKKRQENKNKSLADVFVYDIQGLRKDKFELLDKSIIDDLQWQKLPENNDVWRLEGEGKSEYQQGFSISELFTKNTTGIVTARDALVIDVNKKDLINRIRNFCDETFSDQEIRIKYFGNKKEGKYKAGDSRGWKLDIARKKIKNDEFEKIIRTISYRPFDNRYIYYSQDMVDWGRWDLMQNFVNRENLGLVFMRQATDDSDYNHFIASKNMVDNRFMYSGKGITLQTPLYLYSEDGSKISNLDKEIWNKINEIVGETTPKNILDYIYAVLHSPKYRETYKEFLKIDFPRVPYPKNKEEFWNLVPFGTALRELHLLESKELESFNLGISFIGEDDAVIEKPLWKEDKVYINNEQYFDNISKEVFDFYIGGYQPAQKWLKDRKGRTLTSEDIIHYKKMCVAMKRTIETVLHIDKIFK